MTYRLGPPKVSPALRLWSTLLPALKWPHIGIDPFCPGNLLIDRFRIKREIGSGGMGMVYEAMDEKLDRRVALKSARPGYRDRLPPEVRAARDVSHFNVCKVHDLHLATTAEGDVEFVSMEFIDGPTLSDRISREGPVPEIEAREIARQICAGLAQAHRQGVVHADLKCANIILSQSSESGIRAVITDFGLAKMKPLANSQVDGLRRRNSGLYGAGVDAGQTVDCGIGYLCFGNSLSFYVNRPFAKAPR